MFIGKDYFDLDEQVLRISIEDVGSVESTLWSGDNRYYAVIELISTTSMEHYIYVAH